MDALMFFDAIAGDESACAISEDGRIVAVSPGWMQFARANGGAEILTRWSTGADYTAAMVEPLRSFYRDALARVRASGEPWDHDYECSSPEVRRMFRMRIYPLADGFGIVHALRLEEPYADPGEPPGDSYVEHGVISMCSFCRKVRNRHAFRWDWVPAYVRAMPPHVSHGLCPACAAHYYDLV